MITTKRPGRAAGKIPGDSPIPVRRALQALSRFYKRGQKSREQMAKAKAKAKAQGKAKANGKSKPKANGKAKSEADRSKDDKPKTYNTGPEEMLRKARALARDYSSDEFDRLLSLARDKGFPLGVSHVIRLLSVPAADRRAVQWEMIRGRWSHSVLEVQIQKRYGNRRPAVGRRQQPPRDARAAMDKTAKLCEHWRRFLLSLGKPTQRKSAQREPHMRRDIPRLVRDRLDEVSRAMKRLERTVEAELQRAGPDRAGRSVAVRPGRGLPTARP